jgi:hypothetical protein
MDHRLIDHRLIDKTVCDADPYYVGLPLILAFQSIRESLASAWTQSKITD